MKILFLNPPGPRYLYRGTICTYISKARYVWKPKDFILLSSVLPLDWDIQFLDSAIDQISEEETLQRIQQIAPEAIIMAMSSIVWPRDLRFLKAIRSRFPSLKLLVFGEVFLEPTLQKEALEAADGIIFDPLRSHVLELLKSKQTEPQIVARGKKEPRGVVTNTPRHDLFDNKRYRWPFIKHLRFASVYTQFGCPFTCSYCTESTTNPTYREAESVLTELEFLKNKGYRELQIGDASFGFPKENARRLLQGMIERDFGFSWSCYTYPGLADRETLQLMAKAGCHTVVIGVDSADGALLEKYGRHLPYGKLRDFLANCKENGIAVCGDFILGFKEDTLESCRRTIELSVELDLDYASFNIATPMMGSSIRDYYKTKGVIGDQSTGFDTAGLNKIHGTEALLPADLLRLRNTAVRRFYLRPSYWWKRLKQVRGLEDALVKLDEAYGIVLNLAKQERTLQDGYL